MGKAASETAACLSSFASHDSTTDTAAGLLLILRPTERKSEFIERKITFEGGTVVPIGRASSTVSKHLFEAPDNGYIICPVISRDHAKIECRFDEKACPFPWILSLGTNQADLLSQSMKLYIRDLGSSHGTKVNGTKLVGEHELRSGDILEFGTTIVRGSDTFYPPTYVVEIEDAAKPLPSVEEAPKAAKTQTTVFAVPETDESDGYSDIYSDEDDEDEQENSSPISAAISTGNAPAKSEKELDSVLPSDMAHETSLPSELLSPPQHHGSSILQSSGVFGTPNGFAEAYQSKRRGNLAFGRDDYHDYYCETGLTQYNLGPTKPRTNIDLGMFYSEADDDEPFVPDTFQDPLISQVVKAATKTVLEPPVVPTSNVSAHKNFEYEAEDGESEDMGNAHFSDMDAEESDNDFEPVPSPFAKRIIDYSSVPLPRWPAPLAMDPVTPPVAWEEFRLPPVPEQRTTMNNYHSGPFSLGGSKANTADINTELFGNPSTIAGAEPYAVSFSAPESLTFNGPSHITSSTSEQNDVWRERRPLTKSMAIEHLINADNLGSRKRKLEQEDELDLQPARKVPGSEVASNSINLGSYLGPDVKFRPADIDSFIGLYDVESPQIEVAVSKETDIPSAVAATAETVLDTATTTDTTAEAIQSTVETIQSAAEIVQQPPQKKRKTGSARAFITGTAIGALIGGLGVVAGLASIPESFFS